MHSMEFQIECRTFKLGGETQINLIILIMKTVVSNIDYVDVGVLEVKNRAYRHDTTSVPDSYDLDKKADKSDISSLKYDIERTKSDIERTKADIAKEGRLREAVSDKCDSIERKVLLDCVQKYYLEEVLSNDSRINDEKKIISAIGKDVIEKIMKQCTSERNAIKKEIDAFNRIDINTKLEKCLKTFSTKIDKFVNCAKDFDIAKFVEIYDDINSKIAETRSNMEAIKTAKTEITSRQIELDRKINEFLYRQNSTNADYGSRIEKLEKRRSYGFIIFLLTIAMIVIYLFAINYGVINF